MELRFGIQILRFENSRARRIATKIQLWQIRKRCNPEHHLTHYIWFRMWSVRFVKALTLWTCQFHPLHKSCCQLWTQNTSNITFWNQIFKLWNTQKHDRALLTHANTFLNWVLDSRMHSWCRVVMATYLEQPQWGNQVVSLAKKWNCITLSGIDLRDEELNEAGTRCPPLHNTTSLRRPRQGWCLLKRCEDVLQCRKDLKPEIRNHVFVTIAVPQTLNLNS